MVAVTLKNEGATRGGRYLLYVGLRRRFDQQIGEENWLWENPNGRDFLPPPPPLHPPPPSHLPSLSTLPPLSPPPTSSILRS